jgi:hypothetical protein
MHLLLEVVPFLMSCLITWMTWHMVDVHTWLVLTPSSMDLAHCTLFHDGLIPCFMELALGTLMEVVTSWTLSLVCCTLVDVLLLSAPPCKATILHGFDALFHGSPS